VHEIEDSACMKGQECLRYIELVPIYRYSKTTCYENNG